MTDKLKILYYYLYYKNKRFRSRADLEKWQAAKLEKHLAFVTEHTPFYAEKKGRPLSEFPLMDKTKMMEQFNRLNTMGIDREEAMAFAIDAERTRQFQPKLQNVTVGLSSGTSGSRGIFLISDREKAKWAGYILAKFLPDGIFSKCSIAFFMRADSNLYEAVNSGRIQFHFFDIYRDMEENIRQLKQMNPQILVGQPSLLLLLAGEKEAGRLELAPKLVLSIAEVLEKADERRLKEAFGLPVIHQVYQCTEGCLAATCRCGTLHLNEDIVHIDREYLDDRRFVPIVTDFNRTSQPMIRYRLNDILVERKEPCGCGSPCLALEQIEGREDDVFYFPGRDGAEKAVFPDFIRRCILFAGEIYDYRVIQREDGHLTVCAGLSNEQEIRVRQEFLRLSEEQKFILPKLEVAPYLVEPAKKLKRVEREQGRKNV